MRRGSAAPLTAERTRRNQFNRKAVLVTFARLQGSDPDDLARDLLAPLVGYRHDHAIFALLIARRVADRALDLEGRDRLAVRLRVAGVEAQVMLAARADAGALQYERLAVRTYSRGAQRTRANRAHREPPPRPRENSVLSKATRILKQNPASSCRPPSLRQLERRWQCPWPWSAPWRPSRACRLPSRIQRDRACAIRRRR